MIAGGLYNRLEIACQRAYLRREYFTHRADGAAVEFDGREIEAVIAILATFGTAASTLRTTYTMLMPLVGRAAYPCFFRKLK